MIVPVGIKADAGKEITFTAETLNLPTDILNTLGEDNITDNEDETQISAHSKDDLIKLIQNANLTNPQIQKLFLI